MTLYEFTAGGPIRLPSGITVGDEFKIAGRARVIAIFEERLDVKKLGDTEPRTTAGLKTIRLEIGDVEPT